MATLEFFNLISAEAGTGGEVWLHGEGGEAGLHVRFPVGSAALASQIAAAVNGTSGHGGRGAAGPADWPANTAGCRA